MNDLVATISLGRVTPSFPVTQRRGVASETIPELQICRAWHFTDPGRTKKGPPGRTALKARPGTMESLAQIGAAACENDHIMPAGRRAASCSTWIRAFLSAHITPSSAVPAHTQPVHAPRSTPRHLSLLHRRIADPNPTACQPANGNDASREQVALLPSAATDLYPAMAASDPVADLLANAS